ncbi:MAG: hypothetical protein COA67_06850, partial [Lutibacter sp.]
MKTISKFSFQLINSILFLMLFVVNTNVQAQQTLNFQNPTIVNGGANLAVGTQYRFQNVTIAPGGIDVDALVTITNSLACSLTTLDDNGSILGSGVSDFNPTIQLNGSTIVNGSADGAYIEFFFEFVLNSNNSIPISIELNAYAYDVDGNNGNLREYVVISNFGSYIVNNPTELNYIPSGRFESSTDLVNPGITANSRWLAQTEYSSISNFFYRAGVLRDSGSSTTARFCGLAFQPISFTNPVSIDAVNDNFTSTPFQAGIAGSTTTVFVNDELNGTTVTSSSVDVSIVNADGSGATINSDGTINIPNTATPGTYSIEYRICEAGDTALCDNAIATILVVPNINAENDDFTGTPIQAGTAGTTPSVFLDNGSGTDTANGNAATNSNINNNISISANGGLTGVTINNNGTINVPSGATPATYNVTYQICLTTDNTVCTTAVATILISGNSCTDGATVGIVTTNDPDADGINNSCDEDDDNDGITDVNEGYSCGQTDNWGTSPWLWTTGVDNATLINIAPDTNVTIDVSTSASGDINAFGGTQIDNQYFGGIPQLGVFFDPDANQGTSLVTITITFSNPVDNFEFLISDIDERGGNIDRVIITSNSGNPTIEVVNTTSATVTASGNVAESYTGAGNSSNTNTGDVKVIFTEPISVVTINYEEIGGLADPTGRGIGVLGGMVFCSAPDSDDDGTQDYLDEDSDNDGCNDAIEAGHIDANNDGEVDGTGYNNTNGLVTGASTAYTGNNSDVITVGPDADNDGVADACDNCPTSANPGQEPDADCDGVPTSEDCDDNDASNTNSNVNDADCDGVPTSEDCDDNDASNTNSNVNDADCDGVPTSEDCDDNDASNTNSNVNDADCDGVPTSEDCDDNDASNTNSNVNDADCDGVPTSEDCDDNDASNTNSNVNDADCDGVPTSEDCDDNDASNTNSNVNDADCDGVPTSEDCDDNDASNTNSNVNDA